MQSDGYTIRTMTREEIDMAVEWAAVEGWNPGLHDAHCYAAVDPSGFLVGLLHDEPIATISAVKYGQSFGFVGFYIVKPAYRGKGYGIQLWNAAPNHLDGRNIALDGVVAQQDNYRKSGFELAHRNIRYQGVGGGSSPEHSAIVELSTLPFAIVDAYDRPFFPANRRRFLDAWIRQPGSHALGVQQDGELKGYGVMRPCRAGYKIGPLFADTPELADVLFQALRSPTRPSDTVFLDTPEVNRAAVDLAERHHMDVVFETARMYTGEHPDIALDRTFGVTTFEVG